MRQSDFDLPDYVPLRTNFDGGGFEVGVTQIEGITIEIDSRRGRYTITVKETEHPRSETLWTLVHWCRSCGVPGVWKSRIMYDEIEYRIGALYMIAGFEMTERESNYPKYGECAFDPKNEKLGHG